MANVLHKTNLVYKKSVNTTEYLDGEWIINPDLSNVEGVDKLYWKIDGESVIEMTQEEKDAVDLTRLDSLKESKIRDIDNKTSSIISQGVQFDGETFSLSVNAQSNFMGIKVATDGGLLTEANYPYELTTLDDNAYQLTWELKEQFFGAVLSAISTPLAEGRSLKVAVKTASTIEELNAIVDNR